CPYLKLPVVVGQRLEMLMVVAERRSITARGVAESAIEIGFRHFDERRRCPEQSVGVQRRVNGCWIVSAKEARLQFSRPVPASRERRTRVTRQMALELHFIEFSAVEGAELCRGSAECADERELRRDVVDDETDADVPGKLEATLGFALYLGKRITGREKVS